MGWTAKNRSAWSDILEHLQDDLPTNRPVRVLRRSVGRDVLGTTEKKRREYIIRIKPELSFFHAVDVLKEEYAHCLAGFCDKSEHSDHGPLWGEAYSAVTQSILRWIADKD